MTVVGRKNPVRLYEMVDALPIEKANRIKTILPLYEQAIEAFYTRNFSQAVAPFGHALRWFPVTLPSPDCLTAPRSSRRTVLRGDWDGINHLNDK